MQARCRHFISLPAPAFKIAERPTLERLLDRLNHQQTQLLLQNLVAKQPELIDSIDNYITRIAGTDSAQQTSQLPSKTPPKPSRINTDSYRSQVRQIIKNGIDCLEDGEDEEPISSELLELIAEAQEFTKNDDTNNALAILQVITETCIENWDDAANYGIDGDEIVMGLDDAWTEAILWASLTQKQQLELQQNLLNWQDEWNANFGMSLEALRQGWNYPPLQLVLQGNISKQGAWEGEVPDYADELARIRLRILDRQKRHEEYLYLAEAEGETQKYLVMLASLGRISEALSAAQTQMTVVEQARALALEMWQQSAKKEALEVARIGLSLPGRELYELATWTAQIAEDLGDKDLALSAQIQAFLARPSLQDYCNVERLAGERWLTRAC